ncbi:MAG: hypothetical protein HKN92_09720 [Chitinophagales bacterium]|nr:hypothetical protein [Chitinophagales bacterium]
MRLILFPLLLLTSLVLSAQSDAELLSKEYYSELLHADPNNIDALKALIIYAEFEKDEQAYIKYINGLLNASSDPFYGFLFQHLNRSVQLQEGSSPAAVISSKLSLADSLFRMRKFEESKSVFNTLQQDLKWSLIGPFANDMGSGFEKIYWPETTSFDPDRIDDGDVQIVKLWVEQKHNPPDGSVVFDRLLQNNSFGNVYYANTFIKTDNDQIVEFRLRRNSPVKLWVNGKLVFANPDPSPFLWDSDVIKLQLEKGVHRVLIKSASFPFRPKNDFLTFFDRPDFQQPGQQLLDYNFNEIYERIGLKFGLRMTADDEPFELIPIESFYNAEPSNASTAFLRSYHIDPLASWLASGGARDVNDYYFLAKAFLLNGDYKKGEEFFHQLEGELKNNKLIQYLKAKFYAYNNKDTEAREMLSTIEDSINPFLDRPLSPIDQSNDPKATKQQRKARYKTSKKKLKTEFTLKYYNDVIDYLKDFGKGNKALQYYDELIAIQPYEIDFRKEKVQILLESNKNSETLAALRQALDVSPVDPDLHEALGDIYSRLYSNVPALMHYQNARSYVLRTSYSQDFEEIQAKIDRVNGEINYTDWFETSASTDPTAFQSSLKFPDADAVVLFYDKNILLTKDHEAMVWQEIAIEIKSNEGVADWEETDFSFFGELSDYKVIRSNGSEFDGLENNGSLRFDNLSPGDILYIKGFYEWQPIYDLPGELALMNYMSYDIPAISSKLEMIVPDEKPLEIRNYNVDGDSVVGNKNAYKHYRLELNDIEASDREDAIPDASDTYQAIMFSTMEDWSQVVEWYLNKTYRISEERYEYREIVDRLISPDISDEQKVERIYNWICKNFVYEPQLFLESNFRPKDPVITISEKRGDSKDLSALLIALLKTLDIEAHFVLVKSNQLNHQKPLPSLLFDHVIVVYRNSSTQTFQFIDLSTDHYPYYVLNEDLNNAYALMIKEGENGLIQLPPDYIDPDKNLHMIDAIATIENNGDIAVDVVSESKGLFAGYSRENLNLLPYNERKFFVPDNFGISVFDDPFVSDFDPGNTDENSSVHEMRFSLSQKNFATVEGNAIEFQIPYMKAILPNPVMFENDRINRLKLEYVLQIDPTIQEIEIRFPKGYRLVDLPENVMVNSEFGQYALSFSRISNGILIKKYLEFYKMLIEPAEYKAFQKYYQQILKLDRQILTIRK